MKKILAMVLAALLLFPLVSCGNKEDDKEEGNKIEDAVEENVYVDSETGDKLFYEADDLGGYAIIKFVSKTSSAHKINIPAEIENVEVTGIADNAFASSVYVSEIVLPSSIEYIGDYAFSKCEYLTKVTMTDSVTALGNGAFENCKALETVVLSKNIEVISAYAFRNCKALGSITISEKCIEIEEGAFMACTSLEEVVIPASVKTIGDCAFYGNTSMAIAKVPASVETFGQYVFNAASEDFVLIGAEGSAAQTYAADNDYTFGIFA